MKLNMGKMRMAIKNEKHQAWLDLFLDSGDQVAAYKAVYPDASDATCATASSKLKRLYTKEIFEAVSHGLKNLTPKAFQTMSSLLGSHNEAVKFKAAQAILGYGGHNPVEKKEISVTERSESEIDARLSQLLGSEMNVNEHVKH